MAPEAHQLVRDMVMDLETVNDILRDQKKTGSIRAVEDVSLLVRDAGILDVGNHGNKLQ